MKTHKFCWIKMCSDVICTGVILIFHSIYAQNCIFKYVDRLVDAATVFLGSSHFTAYENRKRKVISLIHMVYGSLRSNWTLGCEWCCSIEFHSFCTIIFVCFLSNCLTVFDSVRVIIIYYRIVFTFSSLSVSVRRSGTMC